MEFERRQDRVIVVNPGVYVHLVLAHVVIALQSSLPLAAVLRRAEHTPHPNCVLLPTSSVVTHVSFEYSYNKPSITEEVQHLVFFGSITDDTPPCPRWDTESGGRILLKGL